MRPGTVSFLIRLYPAWFRTRYGQEYRALLADLKTRPSVLLDTLKGALFARLADTEIRFCRATVEDLAVQAANHGAMLAGAFAVVLLGAAGVYGMVDDSSVAAAAASFGAVGIAWRVLQLGLSVAAVAGLAGIFAIGIASRRNLTSRGAYPSWDPAFRGGSGGDPLAPSNSLRRRITCAGLLAGMSVAAGALIVIIAHSAVPSVSPLVGRQILGAAQGLFAGTVLSILGAIRSWITTGKRVRAIASLGGDARGHGLAEDRTRVSPRGIRGAARLLPQVAAAALGIAAFAGACVAVITTAPLYVGPIEVIPAVGRVVSVGLMMLGAVSAVLNGGFLRNISREMRRRSLSG